MSGMRRQIRLADSSRITDTIDRHELTNVLAKLQIRRTSRQKCCDPMKVDILIHYLIGNVALDFSRSFQTRSVFYDNNTMRTDIAEGE
ncbi:hypothetical protein BOTNAR_0136g00110 [Botryotinia narcissicola]|uniref:Uncharacterized protein n=1 Tax=Botryotinia narcissicola TaxID=278944 RepID=A0A4Z1IHR3_9HELO|nr:hypothetical protein BOTNAR_0136g00110 [Botryotinia narcissicola]